MENWDSRFQANDSFSGRAACSNFDDACGRHGPGAQASGTQDEPQPSAPQTTTKQPASNQSQQNSSQPGLTEKEQQNVQHENETGASKDRIFWTVPNFLTMENADHIPPLTAGQKFKVVGRSPAAWFKRASLHFSVDCRRSGSLIRFIRFADALRRLASRPFSRGPLARRSAMF
jgi:hypothetical protein